MNFANASLGFFSRVIFKAWLIFVVINLLVIAFDPMPVLDRITLYGAVFPARERFPYSEDGSSSYSVTLNSLDAMFASHEISSQAKADDEFRVVLLGDSSVWGWLLENDQTLSKCLNRESYQTQDGRLLRAYNLGYPALSVTKDILILEDALRYEVDVVVWLVTLQALLDNEQLRHPITQDNAPLVRQIVETYELTLALDVLPAEPGLMDKTILGRRRDLADWLRHQIYGFNWWMTGKDHSVIGYIGAPMWNLPDSETILNREGGSIGEFLPGELAWDVLNAGEAITDNMDVPLFVINQPIFISQGLNSEVRYNEYYPRWAFDLYREQLAQQIDRANFLDLWDRLPATEFTDTPFHYTAQATCDVAALIAPELLKLANDLNPDLTQLRHPLAQSGVEPQ